MVIESVTGIYFSPTGTTKKIMDAIIKAMKLDKVEFIDLTLPKVRDEIKIGISNDIALIGVPVYEDRIPKMVLNYLNNLKGNNKPVILVCVYGNITAGITLNELFEITEGNGFKAVGAGAFIGEHSFSTAEVPVAKGRPDYEDLSEAERFGEKIIEKLKGLNEITSGHLKIPKGKVELMAKVVAENSVRMFSKQPIVDRELCNDCGACVYLCPMGAINKDTLDISEDKCIRCFSCVKRCPKKARKIVYKKKILVTNILKFKSRVKKEVKTYL